MKPILFTALLVACGDNVLPPEIDVEVDAGADPVDPVDPPPAVGITYFDFALAIDVSPDGRTAVFEDISSTARVYFYDTISGQLVEKAVLGDPNRALATGISSDNRISAMQGEPVEASVWSEATGWSKLGSPFATGCDQDLSGGFDISADGKTTVGLAWNGCKASAFRWSQATGFVQLEVLGSTGTGVPANRASVISDDGTVVAGFAENGAIDRSAAVWRADGTGFLLEASTDTPSEVLSISADGKLLAGVRGFDGFVWTAGTGIATLQRFPEALPSDPVFPNATSADGALVFGGVGSAFSFSIPTAFVWTAPDGMRSLADVTRGSGIAIADDVYLNSVLGASADGLVLVGTATVGDQLKTFALRLPATAYAR